MAGIVEYSSRGPSARPAVTAGRRGRIGDPATPTSRRPSTSRPGHPSTWKQPAVKVPYLGGLDGLRALAVTSVLLYHADISGWQGGFLGVEVFFVISGYLITAILLAEWRNTHRVDLKTFYIRRARRLLPALFATLFFAALISVVLLPDEVATLRGDIGASLTYVTNWFFVIGQKSYFETAGRPSLLQHLWSLAVEEQFYLVWPILFTLGMRWLGRRRLLVAIIAGVLASAALMAILYHSGEDPSRVYYGTDTRAAGLLLGAALAFPWTPYRLTKQVGRWAPYLLDLVGVVALAVLVMQLLVVNQASDALYRGGFLQLDIVTAVVIAVVVHPAARLGKLLGIRPLRWVGLRSYGIYLFHWPVFQLTRPGLDVPLSGAPLFVLRFGLTFGLATLSYKYLETPIRSGAWREWFHRFGRLPAAERRRRTKRWGGVVVAGALSLVVVTVMVLRATPPPPPDYVLAASAVDTGLPPGPAARTTGSTPGSVPGDAPDSARPNVTAGPTTQTSTPAPTTTVDPAAPTTAAPATVPVDPAARRITAIGDSVMLGAAPALKSDLVGQVFVDARVGRQVDECLQILHVWHDQGLLGDVVVVHIGNNGTFEPEQFDELREILAGVPKVIVLNNKVPRRWEGPNNEVIAAGVAAMPNAVLVDWKAEGDAHPEVFGPDGMHVAGPGGALYASLIQAQLGL